MIEKIVERLKRVFDNVTYKDGIEVVFTVKHKGKSIEFSLNSDALNKSMSFDTDNSIKIQSRGMALDCLDKFMEG